MAVNAESKSQVEDKKVHHETRASKPIYYMDGEVLQSIARLQCSDWTYTFPENDPQEREAWEDSDVQLRLRLRWRRRETSAESQPRLVLQWWNPHRRKYYAVLSSLAQV